MSKKAEATEISVSLPDFTPEQLEPLLEFIAQMIADKIIAEQTCGINQPTETMRNSRKDTSDT